MSVNDRGKARVYGRGRVPRHIYILVKPWIDLGQNAEGCAANRGRAKA